MTDLKQTAFALASARLPTAPIADVIAAAKEIERYLEGSLDTHSMSRKLSSAQRREIVLRMTKEGAAIIEIASAVGLTCSRVSTIRKEAGLATEYFKTPETLEAARARLKDVRAARVAAARARKAASS